MPFVDRLERLARHEVVKNAALLYGVQIGSYIFPLITLPYLSRVLTPSGLGLVAVGQAFVTYFVMFTEYGFNLSATRRIAVEREDPGAVSATFSSVMAAKTLLSAIGFAVMIAAVLLVPKLRAEWLLYLISFLAVVGDLLFPLWLYQGLQKLQQVAARDLGAKTLSLIAIFLLVHSQRDYLWAAGIQSGALAAAGLIGLLMAPKLTGVTFHVPAWRDIRSVMREGAPMFLSMAAMTLYGSTNVFIVGMISTTEEVGYYSAASRLTLALRSLVVPVVGALYPHISFMASRSRADAIRFIRRYSMILSAPFFLGGVLLLVLAPPVESLLFGPKYLPVILLLRIMAFSPFLLAVSHNYTTYYMLAFGFDKAWTKLTLWGVAVNFAVLIPLLAVVRPSIALALTSTALDVYVASAAFIFYWRTAPALMKQQHPAKKETLQ